MTRRRLYVQCGDRCGSLLRRNPPRHGTAQSTRRFGGWGHLQYTRQVLRRVFRKLVIIFHDAFPFCLCVCVRLCVLRALCLIEQVANFGMVDPVSCEVQKEVE